MTRSATNESPLLGRSRCDSCGASIAAWALVPVVSYVVQGRRARCCGARIDPIHPVAEIVAAGIGAVSSLLPLAHAVAAAWFGWVLLTLALIDFRHFRLPNGIVAVLGGTGLASSLLLQTPSPVDSLIGAMAGYLSLEMVRRVYRRTRQRDGIGSGDPKMFAAIGAWVGWEPLPTVLMIGAVAGLIWAGCSRIAGRKIGWANRMPLGTLLAIAAWPVWLWWVADL